MLLEVYALTVLSDLFQGDLTRSIQTCPQLTKLFDSFCPTTSIFIQSYQLALNCRCVAINNQLELFINPQKSWRSGVGVITTAQLHSTKPELRFWAGSNPARVVSEIRDGEEL